MIAALWLQAAGSGPPEWTVSTIGGAGTLDIDKLEPCSVNPKFHEDGKAEHSRFAAPTRTQARNGTLFVMDGMNGCIRTIDITPGGSGDVGSATPCCTKDIATGENGNGPQDMHVSEKYFYLLDSYNNQIKRSPRPFTTWTVLAGNGSRPVDGRSEDGPALTNALNEPHGMAVAPLGSTSSSSSNPNSSAVPDIYIAETWSSCIRLLRGGELTTIAGKCGIGGHRDSATDPLAARFQHLHHVNLDPRNASHLYVSDVECYDDDRYPDDQKRRPCHATAGGVCFSGIRRVVLDAAAGRAVSVSTVAGQATEGASAKGERRRCNGFRDGNASVSEFNYVHGTAFLPVSPREAEERERRRGGSTGTGTRGSAAIFLVDEDNNRIRAVDLRTGVASTLAGDGREGQVDGEGKQARFQYPGGLGLDAAGNIYVGDYEASRIRKLTPKPAD